MYSVADELTFDELLASLPDDKRASVERVLRGGGFRAHRLTQQDLAEARSEGYYRGLQEGRAEKAAKPA